MFLGGGAVSDERVTHVATLSLRVQEVRAPSAAERPREECFLKNHVLKGFSNFVFEGLCEGLSFLKDRWKDFCFRTTF